MYKRNAAPFFHADFNQFICPVSHDPFRKKLFAKLLGAATAVSIAPNVLAQPASSASAPASAVPAQPVVVQAEVRAVARRADSL